MAHISCNTVKRYCMAHARWMEAEEQLKTSGFVDIGRNGGAIKHPLVGIADRSLITAQRAAVELGLTPASRSKVSGKKVVKKHSVFETLSK